MSRILLVALAALALVPAAAQARPGEPDTDFGRRGTVTLKATAATPSAARSRSSPATACWPAERPRASS